TSWTKSKGGWSATWRGPRSVRSVISTAGRWPAPAGARPSATTLPPSRRPARTGWQTPHGGRTREPLPTGGFPSSGDGADVGRRRAIETGRDADQLDLGARADRVDESADRRVPHRPAGDDRHREDAV